MSKRPPSRSITYSFSWHALSNAQCITSPTHTNTNRPQSRCQRSFFFVTQTNPHSCTLTDTCILWDNFSFIFYTHPYFERARAHTLRCERKCILLPTSSNRLNESTRNTIDKLPASLTTHNRKDLLRIKAVSIITFAQPHWQAHNKTPSIQTSKVFCLKRCEERERARGRQVRHAVFQSPQGSQIHKYTSPVS